MKYESNILERLIKTYGVVGNPKYLSEIIKQFIIQGKECYPNLFTYQSEWLSHIDEFGLANDYVVTYTGQHIYAPNTKEKPVKRAILSGQTLVNLATENSIQFTTAGEWKHLNIKQKMLNTTKNYMVKFNSSHDYKGYVHLRDRTTNTYITDSRFNTFKKGSNVVLLGSFLESDLESFSNIIITFFSDSDSATNLTITDVMLLEYQEGMENWDIPYFEGMQSVKMPVLTTTGKNLFDLTGKVIYSENNLHQIQNNEVIMENTTYGYYNCRIQYFNLKPNERYIISYNREVLSGTPYERVMIQDENRNTLDDGTGAFTAPLNGKIQILFYSGSSNKMGKIRYYNIQVEEGTTATSYEPYKTNILTVNEDVTLRSNGDICDELNLLTGQLTQRIDEDGEVLSQGVVKTVDLTIHDKDHQKVERLTTFEGGTHFTTSSQDGSLLPTLTVDVVTDLENTLMVCSLEGNTM